MIWFERIILIGVASYFNNLQGHHIDAGEKISPIFFKGDYLNITYTEDLKKAEKILR
ncbi:MAG: hypothetical protein AAB197_07555 [Deltaproteobacteria bacterium]